MIKRTQLYKNDIKHMCGCTVAAESCAGTSNWLQTRGAQVGDEWMDGRNKLIHYELNGALGKFNQRPIFDLHNSKWWYRRGGRRRGTLTCRNAWGYMYVEIRKDGVIWKETILSCITKQADRQTDSIVFCVPYRWNSFLSWNVPLKPIQILSTMQYFET